MTEVYARIKIELGEKAGREHWVDKNQQKLAQILPVIQTLRMGTVHGQMTKGEREDDAGHRPAERDRSSGSTPTSRPNPQRQRCRAEPMAPGGGSRSRNLANPGADFRAERERLDVPG